MNLPNDLTIYFDGALNASVATYSWIICESDPEKPITHGCGEECRGDEATNNVAEYAAVRNALSYLKGRNWKGNLTIKGDSKLIINQLLDDWCCNKVHLSRLRQQCWNLLEDVAGNSWGALWIPREENKSCDKLSKLAYEQATGIKLKRKR
jgi:ribonuclease HI